jgi:sugar phosphate isomerase/epimerase
MTQDFKIGVVLEAFLDRSLQDTLAFLNKEAPEVSKVEVGAGGYAPHPHLDVDELLKSSGARKNWTATLSKYDIQLDALNAWGNTLHPNAAIAQKHDTALRNAIRLATELGADRVVAMGGCPAAKPGDKAPHFGAGGWLPYLEGVHLRQWEESMISYWTDLDGFAKSVNPDLLVCIELHPGTTVYNVETFERFIQLGSSLAANLDPSHFFWMGMDGHAVVERINKRIGHVHGKDTSFNSQAMALNGLLDHRWPKTPEDMPWNFSVPGRGHNFDWWVGLVKRLQGSQAKVISIEHEDPFVLPTVGVPEAAKFLARAIKEANLAGASS